MRIYDNEVYANGRLVGTYVRHKDGTAIEVKALGGHAVHAKKLVTGEEYIFPYNELDINPVPLGYINIGGRAVYIARTPMRNDWKQGARPKNLRWIEMVEANGIDPPKLREELPRKPLGELIEGKFPKYIEVVKALAAGKIVSKAWDRNFAMNNTMDIYHKGKFLIGKMLDPLKKEYQLNDASWWAKEALEESLA